MKTPWLAVIAIPALSAFAATPHVDFAASSASVACHDFLEVTLRVSDAETGSSAHATVTGVLSLDGRTATTVEGFVDDEEGRSHRIRFMPSQPGNYNYSVTYRSGEQVTTYEGRFEATEAAVKGMLRVDPEFPNHFQWTGTKERFFWNGLTACASMACDADALDRCLERLDRARITGIRVAIREGTPAAWQAVERLVASARKRDMVVAITVAPAAADAALLARQAVARLSAFRNVIWDAECAYSRECDATSASPLAAVFAQDAYGHLARVPGPGTGCVATPLCRAGEKEAMSPAERVRMAWKVSLAGGYPTLGASPCGSCGGADACGDDAAAALEPYAHLYDLFTGITWWKLRADPDLIVSVLPHPSAKQLGLPAPQAFAARNAEGDLAAVYVTDGGVVSLRGERLRDQLKPLWFSPRDGGMRNARALRDRVYRTPTAEDWVLLFRTPCNCSFRDFDNEFEQ